MIRQDLIEDIASDIFSRIVSRSFFEEEEPPDHNHIVATHAILAATAFVDALHRERSRARGGA